MHKIKNKIRLIFPQAVKIKTDKYGYTDFVLLNLKEGRFMLWDDDETIIFHYKESIDKFRPSSAYLSCNINDKKSVSQFKKDILWCLARKYETKKECFDNELEWLYGEYKDYLKQEREKNWDELYEFRVKMDKFLDKFGSIIKYYTTCKKNHWSSVYGSKYVNIVISNNIDNDTVQLMFDFADEVGLGIEIYSD